MKKLLNLTIFRTLVALVLVALAVGLAPIHSQAAPPGTFSGKAGALAFGLDLLFANPAEPEGIAAGVSTAEANSTPFATGKGAGTCNAVPSGVTPVALPCEGSDNLVSATASSPGQSNDPAEVCSDNVPAPVASLLDVDDGCGNARASITAGDPLGEGEGSVALAKIALDLTSLAPELEENKDMVVEILEGLIGEEFPPELDELLDALFGTLLGEIDVLKVKLGATKSIVSTSGNILLARADATGGTIGLLGIPVCQPVQNGAVEPQQQGVICFPDSPDPLTHGLIIIELAKAFSEAKWDPSANPGATATAQPLVVNVKIRDLTQPGDDPPVYIEIPVPAGEPPIPNPLFAGLPFQTSVTLFGASKSSTNERPPPAAKGNSSATSGFLEIHALQGLGGSAPEGEELECLIANCDGGIRLRIASTEALAQGEVQPPSVLGALPITGGERVIFLAVAAILAASAVVIYRKSRRLRNSA